MLGRLLVLVVLTSGFGGLLLPQESSTQSAGSRPAFEVVSIKLSGPKGMMGYFTYPGGRDRLGHQTLDVLLMRALSVQYFQVSGGPAWGHSEQYDIEAKPAASPDSDKLYPTDGLALNTLQRHMLLTLLEDRFQLKYHREVREGRVYFLTRGSKPLKLENSKYTDPDFSWVGGPHLGGISGDGIAGHHVSMPALAANLSPFLEQPVFDQTGINGFFDFQYEYAADVSPESRPDVVASIITSLQEIGLKLVPGRGPVETIVIDSAQKPSEN